MHTLHVSQSHNIVRYMHVTKLPKAASDV